jgi:predicted metalloprotease with PDZ domain
MTPRRDPAQRPRFGLLIRALLLAGLAGAVPRALAESTPIRLELDARDLPRRLLHSRLTIPCAAGKLALWYPKWIPGTHAPSGPLDSVAGLRIETPRGEVLPWKRDQVELHRITCDVPEGVKEVIVALDTICNAAEVEASGHLSYGNASVGIVNWPTCLLYPEGPRADEVRVAASLRLPPRWTIATALRQSGAKDGAVSFATVTLDVLADSPLIAGEHLRTFPLETGGGPPAFFHVASESPSALRLPPDVVRMYGRMTREAGALFGAYHFPEFHFLVTCSDELGYLGLEHLSSSLNGVRERDLIEPANRKGWVANLIPHEYVHSWCGKYRRPAGQCTPDFHTPMRTPLLWVYEGLAEYLGELLMVRCGLVDPKEYRETLAATIGGLMLRAGRSWRPLEDTAVAGHLLRSGSPAWSELRRGQDFYFEGALLWMEADAVIRERSHGTRSLDDFCRRFFGKQPAPGSVVPYDLAEIVRDLNATAEYDWEPFLTGRVGRPLKALPLELVGRLGYRLRYVPDPPAPQASRRRRPISAAHSLGVSFGDDGRILDIVPGSVADRAGLAPGQKVMGVNDRLFSLQRLQDALADSVALRKVSFLLLEGDRFRTLTLDYADGPKYLELVRDDSRTDLLAEMLRPRTDASR